MLYLVQHGFAMDKDENPDRPLTDRGRDEVLSVARTARRMGLRVARIAHSGKLRAQQTAEIFAETIDPTPEIEEQEILKATKNPSKAAKYVSTLDGDVMLVGHKPHLPKLTSFLILGDADREVVSFRKGAITALEEDEDGWRLAWILTPEIAAMEAAEVSA